MNDMKRFLFGSKQRKRDNGPQQKPVLPLAEVAETRTEVTRKETQTENVGSPRERAPRIRKGKSTRRTLSCGQSQPWKDVGSGDGGGPSSFSSPRLRGSPIKSPEAPAESERPPSILHNHNQHTSTQFRAATAKASLSPTPPFSQPLRSHNPRVRFLSSSCESVASSTASGGVHLMAGCPNSVASSSAAMSSSEGNQHQPNHQNVFDRVLHMVMAEENVRLNAMGMQSSREGEDQDTARTHHRNDALELESRFARADKAVTRVLAPVRRSASDSSDDGLGHLVPPRREDLMAPIDMDTGLEIRTIDMAMAPIDADTGMELGGGLFGYGRRHTAPIDADTGLEIHCKGNSGGGRNVGDRGENQRRNLNDNDLNESRRHRLNNAALMEDFAGGMTNLKVAKSRQCRSFERSSRQQLLRSSSHHSDPVKYRQGGTMRQPSNISSGKKKKDTSELEGWVALNDDQGTRNQASGSRRAPCRVSNLAAC